MPLSRPAAGGESCFAGFFLIGKYMRRYFDTFIFDCEGENI